MTHQGAVGYYPALVSQWRSVVLWLPLSVCLFVFTYSSESCRWLSSTPLTVLVCCSMIASVCLSVHLSVCPSVCLPVFTHQRAVGYFPALLAQCWSVVLCLSVCTYSSQSCRLLSSTRLTVLVCCSMSVCLYLLIRELLVTIKHSSHRVGLLFYVCLRVCLSVCLYLPTIFVCCSMIASVCLSVCLSLCLYLPESCRLLSSTRLTVLVCCSMSVYLSVCTYSSELWLTIQHLSHSVGLLFYVCLFVCTYSYESCRLLSSTSLTVLVCCSTSVCVSGLTHLRAVGYYRDLVSQCWSVFYICLSVCTYSSEGCKLLFSTRLTVLVCCSMSVCLSVSVLTHQTAVGYYRALVSQCRSVVLCLSVCQYLLIWGL